VRDFVGGVVDDPRLPGEGCGMIMEEREEKA